MSISYQWIVKKLACFPLIEDKQNVVCLISWELKGVNERNVSSFVDGNQDIPYDQNASFIDFKDLTEEQTLGWLFDSMGQEHVSAYEKIVAEKIDLIENPKVTTPPLPW